MAAIFRGLIAAAKGSSASDLPTDFQMIEEGAGGLDAEYCRLVMHHLGRWGVPESCATVEIQRLDVRQAKEVFVAVVCLTSWDRNAVVRVLLGLPLLDKKIRKAVDVSWLADVSEFQGVQVRVTDSLHDAQPSAELRHLVVSLTGPRETYRRPQADAVTVV